MDKWMTRYQFLAKMLLLLLYVLVWAGCAHYLPLPDESRLHVYVAEASDTSLTGRWAPAFLAYDYAEAYNRIGRPVVERETGRSENIVVDVGQPAVYTMTRSFMTEKGQYTNLIYRVHFPGVPFSLIPFNLTTGKNVGLLVVVTLDQGNRPVLVTSVHSCGCYLAIVPTDFLPADALPVDWADASLEVYGERLPNRLDYSKKEKPTLLVHLRPGVHRVMDLEIVPARRLAAAPYAVVSMDMAPMDELLRLPTDGETISFYHEDGILKGHVKGAVKPLETLFLSVISLDLFVGTDKIYADPEVWGNRFYTSLKPWRREDSDMWDFARFLQFWGWRL
jgi:hypothetical protein